jgi:hypothetical protein
MIMSRGTFVAFFETEAHPPPLLPLLLPPPPSPD